MEAVHAVKYCRFMRRCRMAFFHTTAFSSFFLFLFFPAPTNAFSRLRVSFPEGDQDIYGVMTPYSSVPREGERGEAPARVLYTPSPTNHCEADYITDETLEQILSAQIQDADDAVATSSSPADVGGVYVLIDDPPELPDPSATPLDRIFSVGHCTVPRKVTLAALAYGAEGVLIASDKLANYDTASESERRTIADRLIASLGADALEDDWNSPIPSMFISVAAGEKLKKAIGGAGGAIAPRDAQTGSENHDDARKTEPGYEQAISPWVALGQQHLSEYRVALHYGPPKQREANVEVWLNPLTPGIADFLHSLGEKIEPLSDRVTFTFHYNVFPRSPSSTTSMPYPSTTSTAAVPGSTTTPSSAKMDTTTTATTTTIPSTALSPTSSTTTTEAPSSPLAKDENRLPSRAGNGNADNADNVPSTTSGGALKDGTAGSISSSTTAGASEETTTPPPSSSPSSTISPSPPSSSSTTPTTTPTSPAPPPSRLRGLSNTPSSASSLLSLLPLDYSDPFALLSFPQDLADLSTLLPGYVDPDRDCFAKTATTGLAGICGEDPDYDGILDGRDVVTEAMRQMCIVEGTLMPTSTTATTPQRKNSAHPQDLLWRYISSYSQDCGVLLPLMGEANRCGDMAAKVALPTEEFVKYTDCMNDPARGAALIQLQAQQPRRAGLSIALNGMGLSGLSDLDVLVRMLCESFDDAPSDCFTTTITGTIPLTLPPPQKDPLTDIPETAASIAQEAKEDSKELLRVEEAVITRSFLWLFLSIGGALIAALIGGAVAMRRVLQKKREEDIFVRSIRGDAREAVVAARYRQMFPQDQTIGLCSDEAHI